MTTAAMQPMFSRRTLAIAGSVALLHGAALWALRSGPPRPPEELIVPAQMLAELVAPEPARIETPAPPVPQPQPVQQPVVRKRAEPPRPTPQRLPAPPQPAVPVAREATPQQAPAAAPAPAPSPAPPVAAVPAPAPAPAAVELPSTAAEYLQNPPPAYPPASRRSGEQGKVIVRVLIGADGLAKEAELRQSSGFDRLDRAALETVRKWRYVPGKRAGVPEAMWFNVPINFVLE
jgi:protein TonB